MTDYRNVGARPPTYPRYRFAPSKTGHFADVIDDAGTVVGHVRRGEIQEVCGETVAVLALEVELHADFARQSGFVAGARDLVEGNGFAAYPAGRIGHEARRIGNG